MQLFRNGFILDVNVDQILSSLFLLVLNAAISPFENHFSDCLGISHSLFALYKLVHSRFSKIVDDIAVLAKAK